MKLASIFFTANAVYLRVYLKDNKMGTNSKYLIYICAQIYLQKELRL